MLIAVEGILEMIFQMKFSVRIHREKYWREEPRVMCISKYSLIHLKGKAK